MHIVYYSIAQNTERFVNKLGMEATRVEMGVPVPSILVTPTYGDAALPAVVRSALKHKADRDNVVAVIGTGNINFGDNYCAGARKVADRLGVPLLYRLELAGTTEDVEAARRIITDFSQNHYTMTQERSCA